ncbi:MAG: gamma-glutamyltransferase [Gemmatimonadaceae bacterium]|jgi:gamma-glutamyltranspeptidase/glutathione hydrolase|nr:gamma-glutamyltransferase [Gemmatimonadaceae bacterium]
MRASTRTSLALLAVPTALVGVAACGARPSAGAATPTPSTATAERATPSFPSGWRFKTGEVATEGAQAMVVSNSRQASEAGVEILRAGGNAVDAAVAVGFALAVTWPEAGNIGGGGFMLMRMANGQTAAVDYREMGPGAASRDMYLDGNGQRTNKSTLGHLASGVPGAVAGMAQALRERGTMSLAQVMAPAIRLARDGFVVDSALAQSIAGTRCNFLKTGGEAVFCPGGTPMAAGARLVQADLGRTLQAIADMGPDAFYRGWIADSLVAEMARGGGIITKADLAAYRAEGRTVIRSAYRGHTLLTMPPVSSGGATITLTANILAADGAAPAFGTAAWTHLLGSAYQRAFAERNVSLGDPAFVKVPLEKFTSPDAGARWRRGIDMARATPTSALETRTMNDGDNTTHYSVVDAMGNAVSTTTTLNGSWGAKVWVRGAGFMLNNEMDDFATAPGKPNMFGLVEGEQNAVQPRKRMLSSMSPSIVLDPAGRLLLVVGAAGGPTIITGTSQVIFNVIDHRMSLADAMRAPRIHHQALPDSLTYEDGGLSAEQLSALTGMGHRLRRTSALVNVNAIMRGPRGGWQGVSEPRRPLTNGAVGY